MKYALCLLWLVVSTTSPSFAAEPQQRFWLVGETTRGTAYMHGNQLPGPYVVSVSYTVSGQDTTWGRIYVNGIPTTIVSTSEPKVSKVALERATAWIELGQHAKQTVVRERARRLVVEQELSESEELKLLAAEYEKATDQVDSVTVLEHSILVYRSNGISTYVDRLPPGWTRPNRGLMLRTEAARICDALDCGDLVFISQGRRMTIPATKAASFRVKLEASLKEGSVAEKLQLDPKLVRDLVNPRPISELRREEQ